MPTGPAPGGRYIVGEPGSVRMFLWPGAYDLRVHSPGFEVWKHRLEVAPADRRIERVATLIPELAPAAPSSPREAAPVVMLNHPAPDITVSDGDLVILGLVTDDVGIAAVEVSLNGAAVPFPPDETATDRSVAVRVPVALRPGQNVIEVTARNHAGQAIQVVRTVTRAHVPAPVAATKAGTSWAVLKTREPDEPRTACP